MADVSVLEVRTRKKVAKQLYDALSPVDHSRFGDDDPQAKNKGVRPRPDSPYSIQNIIWFMSSIAVFYYTDFARTALYDQEIKRTWFNIGAALICVNLVIASFLIVYLSWIRHLSTEDWDRHYPAAIPIATGCFAFGSLCVTIGLWPVWGVLTIPILFTQFMGVVVVIAALPPWI